MEPIAPPVGEHPHEQGHHGQRQFPWTEEKQVANPGGDGPQFYVNPGLIPDTPSAWPSGAEGAHVAARPTRPESSRKRRRTLIIIACVVLACVIVGAVVGGVLGSRHSNSACPETPGETSAPHSNPQSIRPNSRLAVTGWLGADGDFSIRLFYQGQDDLIRFSTFTSTGQWNWSRPTVVGLNARSGSSLAACTFIAPKPVQIELYYLNKDSMLTGQYFINADYAPITGFQNDSINSFPIRLENARLSCFMPFVVAQEAGGGVRSFLWNAIVGETNSSRAWGNDTLPNLSGSGGSGIVTLPITAEYSSSTAFVFRRGDGTLGNYDLSQLGDTSGTSWDAGTLSVPISTDASIGAFTVARGTSTAIQDVNTYILYQDADGTIQVVWQDDVVGGWKGPQTFPALAGADKGTDIVCVTQSSWNAIHVFLKTISTMNRCYFQSSGAVKEVMYDGSSWKDMGFLPMD